MTIRTRIAVVVLGGALWPLAALASDGVLEINQTCAAVGCFPGDTSGFPVSITASGSYRLTSNLVVPNANTTAIELGPDAANSSIDLGGFAILGPTSCSFILGTCTPVGTGHGIRADNLAQDVSVRGGRVIGMGSNGVLLEGSNYVQGVIARSNGGAGIEVGQFSSVIECQASNNGGAGIRFDENTSLGPFGNAGESVALGNLALRNGFLDGSRDIENGGRTGGNRCSDGSCSARGARRYYLASAFSDGAGVASVCKRGFHMASLWEIADPSSLEYLADTEIAVTGVDTGSGPPSSPGWIRTGSTESPAPAGEQPHCRGHTSNNGGHLGTIVQLSDEWSQDPVSFGSFDHDRFGLWERTTLPCSVQTHVWCVED